MQRVTYSGRELYPRRFSTGSDLKGKPHTLTILKVEPVKVFSKQMNKEQEKYAIHFERAQRPFLLGKQLADSIAQALNEYDIANWTGKEITIYPVPSKAGGDMILARKPEPKPEA